MIKPTCLAWIGPQGQLMPDGIYQDWKNIRKHPSASEYRPLILMPDGFIPMPERLTAENGAKGALIGEFHEKSEVLCSVCAGLGEIEDGDDVVDCTNCKGCGSEIAGVPIGWTTIKDIYKAAVKHFHPEITHG